jgi:hypothetical protein
MHITLRADFVDVAVADISFFILLELVPDRFKPVSKGTSKCEG